MKKKRMISLLGTAILVSSLFAPAFRIPALGNVSYFFIVSGGGTMLILLSVFSLAFTLKDRFKELFFASLTSSAVIVISFIQMQKGLSIMSPEMAQGYHLSWGWGGLLAGACTMTVASVMKESAHRQETVSQTQQFRPLEEE